MTSDVVIGAGLAGLRCAGVLLSAGRDRATGLVNVELTVSAKPQDVWNLLVGLRAWPSWGPTVRRAALEGGKYGCRWV